MSFNLTHFESAFLFSLFTSVVFAITTKNSDRERLIYGAKTFGTFLAVIFGVGWLIHFV
jgi:hypothetical protein